MYNPNCQSCKVDPSRYGERIHYPSCLETPARSMTPEEREVIEAAKALRRAFPERNWDVSRLAFPEAARFCAAVDALPKPRPTLVERLRLYANNYVGDTSGYVQALTIEAANELERLGAK